MNYDHIHKYFIIILCALYIFSKLIGTKTSIKIQLLWIPISYLSAFFAVSLKSLLPPLNLFIIYCTILIFGLIVHKKSLNFSLVISVVSFGICYILYIIGFFLTIPLACLFFYTINDLFTKDLLTTIVIGLNQILSTFILFRIRRFKSGLVSFENKLSNDLSVVVSIIVLFFASLVYIRHDDNESTVIVFSLAFIGLLLYFYFKHLVTNKYINKVQIRNNKILETSLEEEKQKAENLLQENQELSKIIHRDNKLIPSMLIAIEEILNCTSPDEQKVKSRDLLPQLKTMAKERSEILKILENNNKQLPSTGSVSLDSSFKYLLSNALKSNISLDLSVTTDTDSLNFIDENDLNTLILDLVENAIIATSSSENKNILIVIGTENQNLSISIFDSGNHFHPDVIKNLGLKRITTHKKSGGSGIGMITTFDILKKYDASFILNELIENKSYTKEIKLLFDKKSDFKILTERKELVKLINKRSLYIK